MSLFYMITGKVNATPKQTSTTAFWKYCKTYKLQFCCRAENLQIWFLLQVAQL